MSAQEAARDIAMDAYADWGEGERLVANVAMLYREFGDESLPSDIISLLGMMATYRDSVSD